jgi:hypothetical protein
MLVRFKSGGAATLIALAMSMMLSSGCRNRTQPGEGDGGVKPAGEPEQYSATVIRIVEDGTRRETSVTREARSGEKRREEWTEEGKERALIWRPDIGKAFLLDLARRTYLEIDIAAAQPSESRGETREPHGPSNVKGGGRIGAADSTVQAIDQYFDDAQPPIRVETETLSPSVIDGHACVVSRRRAVFPDGHTETTTRFQATDLSGLLLRIESGTEQGSARMITERRDVRSAVAPDAFDVPAGFTRVQKLTP